MFERYTEKLIKYIMLAQEETRRLGHNFVGTEQILAGLVSEGTGIAAKTLKSMGVELKNVREETEKIIGRGNSFIAVEIPFTPRAARVLEFAWDEARQLEHRYIGTEHMLLALIREGEGVAARVLENLGVDLTKIRSHVIRQLGNDGLDKTSKTKEEEELFLIESIMQTMIHNHVVDNLAIMGRIKGKYLAYEQLKKDSYQLALIRKAFNDSVKGNDRLLGLLRE